MLIVDLPIPPGFAVESDDLEKLAEQGKIDKFQIGPRSALVYLRELGPAKSCTLEYRLRATIAGRVQVPPAVAYEYYTPERTVATAPQKEPIETR
jgi:uncharacterized protein YfaS (alpha-2-macroglobulin family)